ncbi:MAG TPA: ATP-binding protein, partial [Candidatus Hydrogenedentes bacterium]|nr:ATP-binding protein [Candidatus Hydrogenedentota bacterium]
DPVVLETLERARRGDPVDRDAVLSRLLDEVAGAVDLKSEFHLFDASGRHIVGTTEISPLDAQHPEWVGEISGIEFKNLFATPSETGYKARIVSPVSAPGGATIGFIADDQSVEDLLRFVLRQGAHEETLVGSSDIYEVVYLSDLYSATAYLDAGVDPSDPNAKVTPIVDGSVDSKLAERLGNDEKDSDSFTIWNYRSRGGTTHALMAYHRLMPNRDIFIVVYRPRMAVFANINLAAVISFVVSVIVIALFCIVAYRNVHNNIIRAVSLLNEGAQIIKQGDYELKLKIGTGDEIEQLANSFNEMASALRRNIKQLEDSEEKYRSLINSMRDGIYQTDPAGCILFMNPAGVEILGFRSVDEVMSRHLKEFFVEEGDFARATRELARRGYIERTRVWMRRRDDQAICVEITSNRIESQDGTILGMEGAFRDVTRSVRLEQEARERSERISAINQIANVINSSLEAGRVYESIVGELRKVVRFDYASVSLRRDDHDGFETRQLWPEPHDGAAVVRREEGDSCADWVARKGRTLIVNELASERPAFVEQFPPGVSSCLCTPLHANERIIGSLNLGAEQVSAFTTHDIEVMEQMAPHVAVAIRNAVLLENLQHSLDEVTRAREELHRVNEELKTLDEMKTNLLSNVSHELRTPLVAVMGYTDMILNGKAGPVNDTQREYLGISLRNVEKLVTLIENLLDFSRLHRGQEELVFDTFDLVDCALTSIQIVQPVADSRGITMQLNAPAEPVLVEGDKGKLGQVFNNLLSNAVKFNKPAGQVSVDIRVRGDNVETLVSDTGIGIPKEALDKIFTRFYQYDASSTRKYGGTGIGLSISQDIMRLHGSRIMAQSEEGKGSVFHFTLPLSGTGRAAAPVEGAALPLPTETHLLVCLVTQDRALSAQVRNMLLSERMDIIHAAYPAAAVTLVNRYSPDCMVVDTQAGPLGSVVLEDILSDPSAADIPVILITNDDQLYARYRHAVAGRIKRGFRRSTLLSGIHYALSKGVAAGEQLGYKILTVDDDQEICMFIRRCLEPEGYVVDQCSSGEEALALVATGEYWLVLLDIAMPGLDGWHTCARIKGDRALAGVKVYLVTAKAVDQTLEQIQESGADGYLLKPFKSEDLVALVQGFETSEGAKSQP